MSTQLCPDLTTPDAFRAWLLAQPPGTSIGYAARTDCCPLQRFIARHGCTEVTETTIYFDVDGLNVPMPPIELPAWAATFVHALDAWLTFGQEVTPEQALHILDAAMADENPAIS